MARTRIVFAFIVICILSEFVTSCGGGGNGGGGNNNPPPTYYTVTLQLTGVTGTLSATSVTAGSTVTVTGVGLATGYQAPIVATNCTLSGTTCTSSAINANITITLSATAIPTYTITLNLIGTTGTLSTTSVTAGSTVTVTGVGVASGYQTPITATNCTLSGTTCTSGAINSNTTITLTATAISVVTHTVTVVYDYGLSGTATFSVQDGHGVTPTATASTGFKVIGASGTCVGTFSGTSFAISSVTSDCTVHFNGGTVGDVFVFNQITKFTPNACWWKTFSNCQVEIDFSTYNAPNADVTFFRQQFDKNQAPGMVTFPASRTNTGSGEQRWTVSFHPGIAPSTLGFMGELDELPLYLQATDSSGSQLSQGGTTSESGGMGLNLTLSLMVANEDIQVTPTQIGTSGVWYTKHVINITTIPCPGNSDDGFDPAKALVQQHWGDVFSALSVVSVDCTMDNNIPNANWINAQDVAGLGMATTAASPGTTLRHRVVETLFDGFLRTMFHELSHRYLLFWNHPNVPVADSSGIHQNLCDISGQMGHTTVLSSRSDGNWDVIVPADGKGPEGRPFSTYELYGWGYVSSGALPTIHCAKYPNNLVISNGIMSGDQVMSITGAALVNEYGMRSGPVQNPTLAFAAISQGQMPSASLAAYEYILSYFEKKGVAAPPVNNNGLGVWYPLTFDAVTSGYGTFTATLPSPSN